MHWKNLNVDVLKKAHNMIICYLSLGSNLQTPERQLRMAFNRIRKIPNTAIIKISDLYFNDAIGRRGQPPYCNCVIKILTTLPPSSLLSYCLRIEKKQHRIRKIRWGARTLDIDILLYGDKLIHQKNLTIPHPRMLERDFVLIPLSSIAPNLVSTLRTGVWTNFGKHIF